MAIIQAIGHTCYIAKAILQHAFNLPPVRPDCYRYLGFMLNWSVLLQQTYGDGGG